MTEVQISSTTPKLSREEYQAAIARLHAYSDKIKTVIKDAQRGSMAAAADLYAVYQARYWVDDLPPIKVAHRRGQPVKPDSIARFAQWVQEHSEQVGDVYTPNRITELFTAHRVAVEYLSATQIYSTEAVKPLKRFMKDRQTEIPDIARRIREITDGGPVTENAVKLAVHDHNRSIIPAKVASSGRRTVTDHATIIRSEFRAILNAKRFRDAGALLNELRTELMAAAGVTDEQ